MHNVRSEMATKKKSKGKVKGRFGLTDVTQKHDLPQMLRGDTWPGQKTAMGSETLKGRSR
jgi:hypothetical protein